MSHLIDARDILAKNLFLGVGLSLIQRHTLCGPFVVLFFRPSVPGLLPYPCRFLSFGLLLLQYYLQVYSLCWYEEDRPASPSSESYTGLPEGRTVYGPSPHAVCMMLFHKSFRNVAILVVQILRHFPSPCNRRALPRY
ncbi:hypothetical protein CI102_7482 [Trichoderma harzianum]|uniref:Uncharacterized protein n=1 Tax=Trichoderma harzianum CBS 226.95 TaxID=983964 RepID=A0A2T4ARF4_TRIHA|nr:hypothetical protein M431DRAFT_310431 [Trichoderma harzianum CBS 226.95]PKK47874.1 hypothetical protein CI102_7482 [Trichoderma harzianum]PTB59644.1 hypothetical protein M431DRAFT_310431 [Trichoderma harzianum CBS 226.95]